jgi:hypothetical protein
MHYQENIEAVSMSMDDPQVHVRLLTLFTDHSFSELAVISH